MSPTKQPATKWNDGDRAKFIELYNSNKINIENSDPAYIRSIRDKYWPGRSDRTFLSNWKTTVANILTQESWKGKRAKAAAAANCELIMFVNIAIHSLIY